MSGEVGSVDFDRFDRDFEQSLTSNNTLEPKFHEIIFSQKDPSQHFLKNTTLEPSTPELTHKTAQIFAKHGAPTESRLNGELGGIFQWGDKGVEVSAYARIDAYNEKGEYARIQAEQRKDGTGSLTIAAGREEKQNHK